MMDKTAAALKKLQSDGTTVLWRPLHEMNGTWFWWGTDATKPSNTEPYKALWRSMFDYYTNNWGLNNLIWVYSVAPSWNNGVDTFYPGSEYVGMVGIDIYSNDLSSFRTSDYTKLQALGKPMAMAESGPSTSTADGTWDTRILPQAIRAMYPDFTYFLQWHSWPTSSGTGGKVALKDNRFTFEMMRDSWIATRDEVRRAGIVGPWVNPNVCPASVPGTPGSQVVAGASVLGAVQAGGLALAPNGRDTDMTVSLTAAGRTTLANGTQVQVFRISNSTRSWITVSLQAYDSSAGNPTVATVQVPPAHWAFVASPFRTATHGLTKLTATDSSVVLSGSTKAPSTSQFTWSTLVNCTIPAN